MPVLFLYYDRCLADEKTAWKWYAAYGTAAAVYLALRAHVVEAGLASQVNIGNFLLLAPRLAVGYLANMLLPTRLRTMYDVAAAGGAGQTVPYLLVPVAVAGVVIVFRRREVVLPALWFFLFLLPVSGVLFLGAATMADRYAYFSSMGFALAVAGLVGLMPRKAAIAAMVALAGWYAVLDLQRSSFWKDDVSLFSRMVEDVPFMSIGYQNLSAAYFKRGDFDAAEKYLLAACFKATDNRVVPTRLTETFWEMKKYNRALAGLQMKIDLEPDNPRPYMQMSRIYGELGDRDRERAYRAAAVRLYPRIEEALKEQAAEAYREGEQRLAEGRKLVATYRFRDALNIDLNFVPALVAMGNLSRDKGDYPAAERFLSRALAIDPQVAAARTGLERLNRELGNVAPQ